MLEIITTALFVAVILTVATDERAAWTGVMAPLLIGLFIFTAATTVGPASGSFQSSSLARPVLYNQEWSDVWIYIVGPFAGAILGGAIWSYLLLKRRPRARRDQRPLAEVLVVLTDVQRPPHPQPIVSNARTSAPPS